MIEKASFRRSMQARQRDRQNCGATELDVEAGLKTPQPSEGVAFVDGAIAPVSEAKLSILDWGFLHSDATYDVAHVWDGRFFRLDDHLARFANGMRELRMTIPYSEAQLRDILVNCVRTSGLRRAYVEMICTRGVPAQGSRDPRTCVNRFYAFVIPFVSIASESQQETGLKLYISPVQRIPPQSVDPRIKNYHWLDLVRGLFDAHDNDHETVVLSDEAGNVVEGPGFNLFTVTGNILVTPGSGVLEGITRRTVLEIAKTFDLTAEERKLPVKELKEAEEVFITSTAGGIMPISMINGSYLSGPLPGPTTQRIRSEYWRLHTDPRLSFPVFEGS